MVEDFALVDAFFQQVCGRKRFDELRVDGEISLHQNQLNFDDVSLAKINNTCFSGDEIHVCLQAGDECGASSLLLKFDYFCMFPS